MTPGLDAGVILKDESDRKITDVAAYSRYATLRLSGTCRDVLGNAFEIDEVFDLRRFIEGFKSGTWARFPGVSRSGEPMKLVADALVNIENMMRSEREVY
jgi:hypothetical protein